MTTDWRESADSAGAECPHQVVAACHRNLAVEVADCLSFSSETARQPLADVLKNLSHARARQENPMPKVSHPDLRQKRDLPGMTEEGLRGAPGVM